ncbi:hypothetical protein, partial [Streptomyces sp. NPDC093554]|uniref:hypothetical protein n=1 Tax=Streptomyces sp. NPDC093554 TaxID=3155074 RepID=UPI003450B294
MLGVGNGWTPTKITSIKIRNMQLEEGNIPTSYRTPSEDQVTTDEFTKKTTDIVKSVDGINENITKVEQNQTGFDKRVAAVEKTAEGITSNVSKLQETQTQQGKTLSEANTTIGQHSEALKLTMKKKDVEDYVGGIGSTNEVRDAPFKQDFKYWTKSNGNTVIDKQVTYKGFSSIRTITQGETADKYFGGMSNFTEVSPGEDMVDSAYFYTDDPASIDRGAALQLEFFDASGGRIQFPSTPIQLLKGVWTRFFVTAKVPAGAVKARLRYHLNRNGRIWMALPMLQRGTNPSSFMENPNDIVNKDKIMDDIADKVATEKYNQKVTELERSITANTEGIDLRAKKTEVYTQTQANGKFATDAYVKSMESRIQLTENGIKNTVQKGAIISEINQTSETIKIKAGKIELDGTTIAKYLEAQELRGTTIRTDNGANYVHIQKQFIKLMESNLNRMFLGYYKNIDGRIQPTILMHENITTDRFNDGTLVIAQLNQGTYYSANFGIAKGETSPGNTYYPSNLRVTTLGDTSLKGDNSLTLEGNNGIVLRSNKQLSAYTNMVRLDSTSHVDIITGGALFMKSNEDTNINSGGSTFINSGRGISQNAKGGSFWAEATDGVTLKG